MRSAETLCLIFILIFATTLAQQTAAQNADKEAFSPNQGASNLVIQTIDDAQTSVEVAAYSFTSRPIADALIAAHDGGVQVRVVVDKSQRKGRHKLVRYLRDNGIETRIDSHYAIMHNKFMIIDGKALELGSFNYTKAAESKNAENVLVLHDEPEVAQVYEHQWQKLWNESK